MFLNALSSIALLFLGCGSGAPSVNDRIDALFGAPPFGTVNRDEARRLLDVAEKGDRPFHLVRLVRHRDRSADSIYVERVEPIYADVGAQTIFSGSVERRPIDPDGAAWDAVSVVLFPGRAAFLAMLEREDFREAAEYEIAGVERAIVLVTEALPSPLPDSFRRVDLSTVPFPPTPEDPPVTVVHVIDFNDVAQYADGRETDLTGREALALYEQARASQALPLGVRPGIQLAVEGELIGDGRAWEEVRVNNFPSRTAFAQLVTAESLDQAGFENREAAIADTYAMLVAPVLNRVGYLD